MCTVCAISSLKVYFIAYNFITKQKKTGKGFKFWNCDQKYQYSIEE